MALLGTSLFWDSLGLLTNKPIWWEISFWNICLGLFIAVFAVISGTIDFLNIPQENKAIPIGIWHMALMLSAVSAYLISLLLRGGPLKPMGNNLFFSLAMEGLGLLLLCLGAWHGGEMVYGFGIGQKKGKLK
jgi:uncharacterized membrane protein